MSIRHVWQGKQTERGKERESRSEREGETGIHWVVWVEKWKACKCLRRALKGSLVLLLLRMMMMLLLPRLANTWGAAAAAGQCVRVAGNRNNCGTDARFQCAKWPAGQHEQQEAWAEERQAEQQADDMPHYQLSPSQIQQQQRQQETERGAAAAIAILMLMNWNLLSCGGLTRRMRNLIVAKFVACQCQVQLLSQLQQQPCFTPLWHRDSAMAFLLRLKLKLEIGNGNEIRIRIRIRIGIEIVFFVPRGHVIHSVSLPHTESLTLTRMRKTMKGGRGGVGGRDPTFAAGVTKVRRVTS